MKQYTSTFSSEYVFIDERTKTLPRCQSNAQKSLRGSWSERPHHTETDAVAVLLFAKAVGAAPTVEHDEV